MSVPTQERKRILGRAGWLLAELVVVFVGVYAAFLLNQHQNERRDALREQQIAATLLQEFTAISRELTWADETIDSVLVTPFLVAYEHGEMPQPQAMPFDAGELRTGTWEAMLQAGGLEVLEPDFIHEVEQFYGALRQALNQMERVERLFDRYMLPQLDGEAAEFYDPKTMRLKEKYRWYEDFLREMPTRVSYIRSQAEGIVERLDERLKEG